MERNAQARDGILMPTSINIAHPQNGAEWATCIRAAWQKTVASIIETDELLIEARHALPPGSFADMVRNELPFTLRTAQRLIQIADHPLLSNATHVSRLPASWGTLYQLSRLPLTALEQYIEDGRINPAMERKDVAALPGAKTRPKPSLIERLRNARLANQRRELEAKDAHIAGLEAAAAREHEREVADDVNPLIAAWDRASPNQRRDFVLSRKDEIVGALNWPPLLNGPSAIHAESSESAS
jgi:hypothetical protein